MGETGLSMANGCRAWRRIVRATDTRTSPPCLEALKQVLPDAVSSIGRFLPEAFLGIDLIAISPGVPLAEPLVQQAAIEVCRWWETWSFLLGPLREQSEQPEQSKR